MKITTVSCAQCPFFSYHEFIGKDACVVNDELDFELFQEWSNERVHENCPLKDSSVTIELQK